MELNRRFIIVLRKQAKDLTLCGVYVRIVRFKSNAVYSQCAMLIPLKLGDKRKFVVSPLWLTGLKTPTNLKSDYSQTWKNEFRHVLSSIMEVRLRPVEVKAAGDSPVRSELTKLLEHVLTIINLKELDCRRSQKKIKDTQKVKQNDC